MKRFIDIDINFRTNEIIFISKGSTLVKDLTEFLATNFDSSELLNDKLKFSYNSIQNVKKKILEDIRKLTVSVGTFGSFKEAISSLEGTNIKEELIKELSKDNDTISILKNHIYLDEKTKIKNELFFKRYFGKEDYNFSDFSQLDDYNEVLDLFNRHMYDTLVCIEINNLKTINQLCGTDIGDIVLETFANEITSVFDETLMIRYGGDEFVLFANSQTANEIKRIVDGEDFLNMINNCLPVLKTEDGVDIFCTASVGSNSIAAPAKVYSCDDIIQFKKMASLSYYSAQYQLSLNKNEIKQKYNHHSLKETYKDSGEMLNYCSYLVDKENSNNVNQFLDYSGELNLDTLDSTIKGLKL